jgi:glycosyltransferase involved in cell wall biosynthesis
MLPIGVVIPTRNCIAYLRDHLVSMQGWISHVAEIVVVDSESTDGTMEFLRENLKHPNLRLFTRPRGLYQAWNFGVSQLQSKYCYFSTIGDSITLEGLQHLACIIQNYDSDLIISPPRFIDTKGKTLHEISWPIHRLLKASQIKEPRVLSRIETVAAALCNGYNSYLGSSASNLYRTEFINKSPFPSTFGHMGDTAWGIQHCGTLITAVSPQVHSTFLFHPKESEPDYNALAPNVIQLAREVKEGFLRQPDLCQIPDALRACDLLSSVALENCYQYQIGEARKKDRRYVFNYEAFIARIRRNRQRKRTLELQSQFEDPKMFAS